MRFAASPIPPENWLPRHEYIPAIGMHRFTGPGQLRFTLNGFYYGAGAPMNHFLRFSEDASPDMRWPLIARIVSLDGRDLDEYVWMPRRIEPGYNLELRGGRCEPARQFREFGRYRITFYGLSERGLLPLAGWEFTAPGRYGLDQGTLKKYLRALPEWERAGRLAGAGRGAKLAALRRRDPKLAGVFNTVADLLVRYERSAVPYELPKDQLRLRSADLDGAMIPTDCSPGAPAAHQPG
jgi:hypothetical protein